MHGGAGGHSEPHCHPDVRRIIAHITQEVDHFSKELYHIRTVYNICVVSRIHSRHAGPPPGSEYDGTGCCFLDTAGFLITAHMCLGRHSPGCGPSKYRTCHPHPDSQPNGVPRAPAALADPRTAKLPGMWPFSRVSNPLPLPSPLVRASLASVRGKAGAGAGALSPQLP